MVKIAGVRLICWPLSQVTTVLRMINDEDEVMNTRRRSHGIIGSTVLPRSE